MAHSATIIFQRLKDRIRDLGVTLDAAILLGIITILNLHLFQNGVNRSMVFMPSAFENGDWWQLLTHPFVHVSFYHLLLDAGAFFILYVGLREQTAFKKLLYVIACGASSLIAALVFSDDIYAKGLCGLSGIAHGLMAVSALEMMQDKENEKVGLFSLILVVTKCIYEAGSGQAVFLFMHMGLCGDPLVSCHAGGVVGGIIMFLMFKTAHRRQGVSYLKGDNR